MHRSPGSHASAILSGGRDKRQRDRSRKPDIPYLLLRGDLFFSYSEVCSLEFWSTAVQWLPFPCHSSFSGNRPVNDALIRLRFQSTCIGQREYRRFGSVTRTLPGLFASARAAGQRRLTHRQHSSPLLVRRTRYHIGCAVGNPQHTVERILAS